MAQQAAAYRALSWERSVIPVRAASRTAFRAKEMTRGWSEMRVASFSLSFWMIERVVAFWA